jgi:putative ABC transport system ATP-binding protein
VSREDSILSRAPSEPALSARLEEVGRRFRQGDETVAALDRVDLEVAHGEFLAVLGPSGSGKSTLLHLLGGLDRPTRGRVLLGGVHVEGRPDGELVDLAGLDDEALSRLRRTSVGFVFQSFNLLPTLTAEENVALPLILDGRAETEARDRARELLEFVSLVHRRGQFPEALSGGERQRVAAARALAPRPSLILADEPTGNLDSGHGAELLGLLRRLVDEQTRTVVMVTHDPGAAGIADRRVTLRDGRIAEAS